MPAFLDYGLVIVSVAAATGYLVWRKARSVRRTMRDWSTGHAEELCHSCPVIKIRRPEFKTPKGTSRGA